MSAGVASRRRCRYVGCRWYFCAVAIGGEWEKRVCASTCTVPVCSSRSFSLPQSKGAVYFNALILPLPAARSLAHWANDTNNLCLLHRNDTAVNQSLGTYCAQTAFPMDPEFP